jgi:hypothetical protein
VDKQSYVSISDLLILYAVTFSTFKLKYISLRPKRLALSVSNYAVYDKMGGTALLYKPEGRGFDAVFEVSHSLNPSGRTMALGSIQPLTEMGTRDLPWG